MCSFTLADRYAAPLKSVLEAHKFFRGVPHCHPIPLTEPMPLLDGCAESNVSKNYAEFDPLSLTAESYDFAKEEGKDSWKLPDYQIFNLHCGYKINLFNKNQLKLTFSVLNMLNELYISDAQNNDSNNSIYQDFDAKSAGVFFGYGRRYNLSTTFTF